MGRFNFKHGIWALPIVVLIVLGFILTTCSKGHS